MAGEAVHRRRLACETAAAGDAAAGWVGLAAAEVAAAAKAVVGAGRAVVAAKVDADPPPGETVVVVAVAVAGPAVAGPAAVGAAVAGPAVAGPAVAGLAVAGIAVPVVEGMPVRCSIPPLESVCFDLATEDQVVEAVAVVVVVARCC